MGKNGLKEASIGLTEEIDGEVADTNPQFSINNTLIFKMYYKSKCWSTNIFKTKANTCCWKSNYIVCNSNWYDFDCVSGCWGIPKGN